MTKEPLKLVAIRPADADRFLARGDPTIRVLLLHGPDQGLVIERAAAFAQTVTADSDDPLDRVALDAAAVAADPGLLADEAGAIPMFGGTRVITLRLEGNRPIHKAIESVLDHPPADAFVVVTAGELRRNHGLRKLCEDSPTAAAIACYGDDGRRLDAVIDSEFATAGLTISDEARAGLKSLLGADRGGSRSEIRKLCVYAADRGAIALDDVRAVVGDAAAFAVDEAVDAMALGRIVEFDRTFRRILAAGTPGFVVAGAAQRHFNFLHLARAACDAGASADAVMSRPRPPVFVQRRAIVKQQIARWPLNRIERGLDILDEAVLESRRNGPIADTVIAQALLRIATAAQSAAPR